MFSLEEAVSGFEKRKSVEMGQSTRSFLIPVAKYLPIAPKFRALVTF